MMKGNWTNCVRIIPNSAMKFFTYEQLSRWVGGLGAGAGWGYGRRRGGGVQGETRGKGVHEKQGTPCPWQKREGGGCRVSRGGGRLR